MGGVSVQAHIGENRPEPTETRRLRLRIYYERKESYVVVCAAALPVLFWASLLLPGGEAGKALAEFPALFPVLSLLFGDPALGPLFLSPRAVLSLLPPGPPWPPPFMMPMTERSMAEASIRLLLSADCPSRVDGMLPSSCPCTLAARSLTVSLSMAAAAVYSSYV